MRRFGILVTIGWLAFVGAPQALGAESGAASSGETAPTISPGEVPAPAPSAEEDKPVTVDVKELMVPGPLGEEALGDPKAPVTVVEYVSMTCTHCARVHQTTFKTLKSKYIDTGKVYFVLREFPLEPLATAAIMLARCAPADKYFPAVSVMFELQNNWAFVDDQMPALLKILQPLGFTEDAFQSCLNDQKILNAVNAVRDRGEKKFGIHATPTFFFNGRREAGELSIEEVEKIFLPMLK
jgi:protein-disulfide isomerase